MARSSRFAARPFVFSRLSARRKKSARLSPRRKHQRLNLESLEERWLLAANVVTDLLDYAPGATAHVFASDFAVGETVEFQVLHTDGVPNTGGGHEPWQVTDGVMGDFDGDGAIEGDLDGAVDGNIQTSWYVNPDDSANSAFELTATGLSSGLSAQTNFTDTVAVTAATGGTGLTNLNYNTLGNIVINEGSNNDIPAVNSASRTLILTAPTGWEFNPGVGSITSSNNDFSATMLVASSTITVTLNGDSSATNEDDTLTISGIQVKATSANSAQGNITRTAANPGTLGNIIGVTNGSTNFGTLSLAGVLVAPAPNGQNIDDLGFNAIGDIVLQESTANGLSGTNNGIRTLTLNRPNNDWEFDTTPGLITVGLSASSDFSSATVTSVTASSITITFTFDGAHTDELDTVTISGIRVKADDIFSNAGNITRSGTLGMSGVTASANFGSLSFASGVLVTPAPNGDGLSNVSYLPIGNIVLNENVDDGFTGSANTPYNFVLSAPAGWEFNPGVGSVSVGDDDFSGGTPSITVTGSTITVNVRFDSSPTSELDTITISGIQARATSGSSTAGNITRSSGSLSMVPVNNTTNFGTLSLDDVPAINIKKLVNGADANTAPGPTLAAGGTATFTYTVTNTGTVPLSNISVVDDNGTPGVPGDNFSPTLLMGSDTNSNGLLDLTETWTYSAMLSVVAGQYMNVATASGKSPANTTVTDTDPANYFGAAPALNIEKLVNGQDADSVTGPILAAGGTATFTYQVTNTGNIAVGSMVVVDDNGTPGNTADDFNPTYSSGDAGTIGLLELGETWTFTANRTVVEGQYTNIGKVTGSVAATGQSANDTDPANYFGAAPAINIEKLVNGQDSDSVTGPILAAGGTATFTYQVTNTGNIAVGSIVVVDDNGTPGNTADDFNPTYSGGDAGTIGLLELGETWTFTANRMVVAGQYSNIGEVTGAVAATGQSASDTDPANYFGAAPAINIEKLVNDEDADNAPGVILPVSIVADFTYTVTNTGNIALSSVAVLDDNGTPSNTSDDFSPAFAGSGDTNGNGLLDIGETWTYNASATVTAGQYTNIGSVSGQVAATGQTASDSDPANYFGAAPAIDIEKLVNGEDADSATGPILKVNDSVTFTYIVTNTGNIALGSVVVVDDNGTPSNTADDFNPTFTGGDTISNGLLDLGETWTYSATSTVIAGQYTNIGKVSGSVAATEQIASDADAANYFGKLDPIIVIAPDKGNTSKPIVKVINQETGKIVSQFYAYEGKFLGGVQLATGDLTGDGIDEIIVAPGQGRVGEVRVFTQHGVELTRFRVQPYGYKYMGGIEVAVGDVNGDGRSDIVTATKYGRPDIRVFYNNYNTAYPTADAIADAPSKQFYAFDSKFNGGADVVVADMGTFYNGATYNAYVPDGKSEIIVGNGPGMRSTVNVYDVTTSPKIIDTILPLSNSFKGGITLSTARVNGDAIPDIIVAAGNGGGSAIETWSGLVNDALDVRLSAFSAFGDVSTKNMPVHATAFDTNGDGIADLLAVVQGTNGTSNQIRYFKPNGTLNGVHYGFTGPWNIASLKNVDPSLPLNTLADMAAKDDVYTQIGTAATATTTGKKTKAKKK